MKRYNEMLTELSKKTLGSYAKKATGDLRVQSHEAGYNLGQSIETNDKAKWSKGFEKYKKADKRADGIKKAIGKLTTEDFDQMDADEFAEVCENFDQLDEISKATLGSYLKKATKSYGQARFSKGLASGDRDEQSKKEADAITKKRTTGMNRAVDKLSESGIEYPVMNARSPADQEFAHAHPVDAKDDANGNGDAVFKGTTTKDTSRKADKYTGDDDADDAKSEEGLDTAGKKIAESFQLQELSKKVLGSYIKKAANEVGSHSGDHASLKMRSAMQPDGSPYAAKDSNFADASLAKAQKRLGGVRKATDKLSEDEELQELSKKTLGNYVMSAAQSYSDHSHRRDDLRDKSDTVSRMSHGASPEVRKAVDNTDDAMRKAANHHDHKRLLRGRGMSKAINRLTKEDIDSVKEDMSGAGTSVSHDTEGGTPKVHVTTGDTKHSVHRQRTMSTSHYVVHDHKSGTSKKFPYASDAVDHLNDNGHTGVNSKHLSALY